MMEHPKIQKVNNNNNNNFMKTPPTLPKTLSADGHEAWDWFIKTAKHFQRQVKIDELQKKIAENGTKCGDCYKWMTDRCPLEKRNSSGRKEGPSMNTPICKNFVESTMAIQFRTKWQTELQQLKDKYE